MIKVNFYDIDEINPSKLDFAVIVARYRGKYVYSRHKERCTWEIAGGHREKDENICGTAKRELYEETGAKKFDLEYICIYSVVGKEKEESFGGLFYAEVQELGELPEEFEMAELGFFEEIPENLTYPLIQPYLIRKIQEVKNF